ncbi:MAG: 1-acyl-sn-glycerol-3-phosphate acyltransferase [Chloroflexi bacterium]|nr:1-acyl-sn-glycerol-3-phosphate acyltransferase [Chloroflexota bacterium]
MRLLHRFVSGLVKTGTSILCRIDGAELEKVPPRGPLIAYANHIGSLEVPLLFAHLQPRPVTALAKVESWDIPLYHWLFNLWRLIPVRRGEADLDALRQSLAMLKEGYIFGIAPEGTRSHDGRLRRAHPGAVPLALHSGAPLLPIAHWGAENFSENIKRLRRTDFHIRVGKAFHLDTRGERVTRQVRQQMVDEMMYQLARLLPEKYRGAYADLDKATEKYLRFAQGEAAVRPYGSNS